MGELMETHTDEEETYEYDWIYYLIIISGVVALVLTVLIVLFKFIL